MSWKSVYASRLFRNAATFFLFCVMLFTTIATTRAEENPGYTELTTGEHCDSAGALGGVCAAADGRAL